MPLMKSKSKQAFEHNIGAEMKAGKPQDQALAIAYSVKRKAKAKKMAQGGDVSVKQQKRPMPEQAHKDSKEIIQNSDAKQVGSSMKQDDTSAQAQKPSIQRLKHPKMVPQNGYSVRLRSQEDDLESSAKPNNGKQEQPSKQLDEKHPNRQGPSVPALKMKKMAQGGKIEPGESEALSSRPDKGFGAIIYKPGSRYAKGGMINEDVSMEDAEQDNDEHPSHLEEDDDQMGPDKSEFMADHMEMMAEGGIADMDEQPADEEEIEHAASIAAAVMAKMQKLSKSAESDSDIDHEMMMADGGEVDINENNEEQPNEYYKRNQEALDWDMDDDQLSAQPEDSNLIGDEEEDQEENENDSKMINAIHKRMKMKSAITR